MILTELVVGLQRFAMQEFHCVEGRPVCRVFSQFVNGNDVWMLQLAGDLGLFDQAVNRLQIFIFSRQNLLERDVSFQVRVSGQPDLTQPAFTVDAGQRIPAARFGLVVDGLQL